MRDQGSAGFTGTLDGAPAQPMQQQPSPRGRKRPLATSVRLPLAAERRRVAGTATVSQKANAKRAHIELRLGELNREIDRLADAIAKGHGDPAVLGLRSSALNEERKQVAMELNVEPAVNNTISLHPAVLARYQEQLVELQDALSKGINAGDSDAAEAIRGLVETVTVFRDPSRPGGVTIEIAGRLNALLGEQAYPNNVRGVWGRW